jgi:hypothetical protein
MFVRLKANLLEFAFEKTAKCTTSYSLANVFGQTIYRPLFDDKGRSSEKAEKQNSYLYKQKFEIATFD